MHGFSGAALIRHAQLNRLIAGAVEHPQDIAGLPAGPMQSIPEPSPYPGARTFTGQRRPPCRDTDLAQQAARDREQNSPIPEDTAESSRHSSVEKKMNDRQTRILASGGLATGGLLGMAGAFAPSAGLRGLAWGIDGIALVMASALLAIHFFRQGQDLVASGFLVGWQIRPGIPIL
jgi:hypothetical protein